MHDLMNRHVTKGIFQDERLSRTSKLVYLGMRAHAKTNITGYAKVLNMPYQTVQSAIELLQQADWVYSYYDARRRRIIRVPWLPMPMEIALVEAFERKLATVANRGEGIMKAHLDLFVDDVDFLDNHRFEWATSPDGKVKYEYDRVFQKARVVIEFQGRQHFQTVTFADGRTNLQEQMARDRAKMLACEENNYVYVEIADVELSWATLQRKLDGLLPLIEPPKDRPLFRKLEQLCASYAQWARGLRQ